MSCQTTVQFCDRLSWRASQFQSFLQATQPLLQGRSISKIQYTMGEQIPKRWEMALLLMRWHCTMKPYLVLLPLTISNVVIIQCCCSGLHATCQHFGCSSEDEGWVELVRRPKRVYLGKIRCQNVLRLTIDSYLMLQLIQFQLVCFLLGLYAGSNPCFDVCTSAWCQVASWIKVHH